MAVCTMGIAPSTTLDIVLADTRAVADATDLADATTRARRAIQHDDVHVRSRQASVSRAFETEDDCAHFVPKLGKTLTQLT
jgi:hypothetical protein